MVMAPDESRFQRHSAHLRTRIIDSSEAAREAEVIVAEPELHDAADVPESIDPGDGATEPH
jgi:hypothetical protein